MSGKGGRGRRSDVDEREEILAHIRIEADRLVEEEGLTDSEAMHRARARFGTAPNLDPHRRTALDWTDVLRRDVRHAFRQLISTPVATAVIVVSLMVGVGVNTAIFSLADQALVRPMDVEDPSSLVQLVWDGQWIGEGRGNGDLLPHPLYRDLRDEPSSPFQAIAARSPGQVSIMPPTGAERVEVELVTGDFFSMLGLTPALGRLLHATDDRAEDDARVVVLSHSFWTSRYGADPDVVGRSLTVNSEPFTIVGVAPATFYGTDWSAPAALWLSASMNSRVHGWGTLEDRRIRFDHVFARLRADRSRADAEAALAPWFASYLRADMERPSWPQGRADTEVAAYLDSRLTLEDGGRGQAGIGRTLRQPILILTVATALLLLLACLNVANLSLARAVARHREVGVRAALGAARWRLVSERLAEAGIVAVVGGGLGVVLAPIVASWLLDFFAVEVGEMALASSVDGRMLMTALGLSVFATIAAGVGPAWYAASAQPVSALKAGGRGNTRGVGARRLLVVMEVTLASVLLVGAGLFGRTLATLESGGPGFEPEPIVTFAVAPGREGYAEEEARSVIELLVERLEGLPGVESVGVGAFPILEGSGWNNPVAVEAGLPRVTDVSLPMNAVTPDFFATLGVELLSGRGFDDTDRSDGGWNLQSVIVSRSFVERYIPDRDPLGVAVDLRRPVDGPARMQIVGVVEDFAEHSIRDPKPQIYFALWERPALQGSFYLRTTAPFAAMAPEIRRAVAEIDPALTIESMRPLEAQIDRLLVFERMLSAVGMAFALFGTLLASIGVYAVLSYAAAARTREMGIRMALGATSAEASSLVFKDALRLVVGGVALALPVLWIAGRWVESQLYGVRATDPGPILFAIAVLAVVGVLAGGIPARRLGRVPPTEAFRVE
jgi:predicted permease